MDDCNHLLGDFLKERRARLDPAAYGLPLGRRRTPGLRREEVAQLAHVSATWYTWLEQGRGGAPSADVLDRLSRAFSLTDVEREHLYLLAQERPPRVRRAEGSDVSLQLQRVLDAFGESAAIIKTPEWTVRAWNRAATVVLGDYAVLPEHERNLLWRLFHDPRFELRTDWEALARLVVSTVRRDVIRAGMQAETQELIDGLSRDSEVFRQMWADGDVHVHGEGAKLIPHPVVGPIGLEYSTFAVDGHPDLSLVVFNPATEEDRGKVRRLLAVQRSGM